MSKKGCGDSDADPHLDLDPDPDPEPDLDLDLDPDPARPRSPDESGEERDEPIGDGDAALGRDGIGISAERCDLHRCNGLDRFSARYGESASLVCAGDAPGAFGGVEAGALGGACSFVAELGIADVGGLDGEQELDGDAIGDELVVRKT